MVVGLEVLGDTVVGVVGSMSCSVHTDDEGEDEGSMMISTPLARKRHPSWRTATYEMTTSNFAMVKETNLNGDVLPKCSSLITSQLRRRSVNVTKPVREETSSCSINSSDSR